jgi:CRP-like cAMP-binding protein
LWTAIGSAAPKFTWSVNPLTRGAEAAATPAALHCGSGPSPDPGNSMTRTHLELLQHMPIFGALRDETLEFLLARSRSIGIAAGELFFCEGDTATAMYVLEAGRVAVYRAWQGRDFVVRHFEAGDCFGEMALMDLAPRSASVRAVQDCRAIELGPGDLMELFEHDVEQFALIQMNIGREVCRRLRLTDDLVFRVRMGEALSPVGEFLVGT